MMPRAARRHSGLVILGALLAVLMVLAAITARNDGSNQNQPAYPAYDVHSSAPDGTRALSLWLAAAGYQSTTLEYQSFRLNPTDKLMFILFPSLQPTGQETSAILDWVERGGTLVVATGDWSNLLERLGLDVSPRAVARADVVTVDPSLNDPPVTTENVDTYATLTWRDPSWVPVLDEASTDKVIGASRVVGQGSVLALTTGDPFSNAGLAEPGNRNLMLNILGRIPPGSAVVIDEYHHGFTEQGTFTYQLVRQPWGWAILYLTAVVFLFIATGGRRFGRTVQPYAHALRRSRAEFATTLASMLHQNRQRDWLREHYVEQLKRSLGARFRVQASLPATLFVEQLALRRPEATALTAPLAQLEAEHPPDERRLVALIRESEAVSARLTARPEPDQSSAKRTSKRIEERTEDRQVVGKMGT